jgi:transposase
MKLEMERRARQTRDLHERLRLCIILARSEGMSHELIAQAHRISVSSVYKYIAEYEKENKTQHEFKGGTESKLSPDQTKELLKYLEEVTFLHTRDICKYVEQKYGIKYSRSGMNHWLKEHDFVYKEPIKVPGKLDPQKQKAFIEYYEKLKTNLPKDEEIYFMDAVHPEFQSQAVCGWIKKGETKTLATTNKQFRLHFIGAIALTNMRVVAREYETVNAENMVKFFKDLEFASEATRIHIICDNGRANKNKMIQEYLKTSKIEIHYLPAYSPNLNAIERLWKIMREYTTYNKCYKAFEEFEKAIRGFFEGIPKINEVLNKRINDSFQSIEFNPILLSTI